METTPAYRKTNPVERFFKRFFGFLVGLGIGLPHNYSPQVRRRNAGRLYSTPVDALTFQGNLYLAGGRRNG